MYIQISTTLEMCMLNNRHNYQIKTSLLSPIQTFTVGSRISLDQPSKLLPFTLTGRRLILLPVGNCTPPRKNSYEIVIV